MERKSQVYEWFPFHRHCQALNDRYNAPSIFLVPGLSSTWANLSHSSLTKYSRYYVKNNHSPTQKLSMALCSLPNPTGH